MKISFFESKPRDEKFFSKELKGHKLSFEKEPLTEKNAPKDAEAVAVFIYSKVDKKALSKMPKLKLVVTRSTGFDHVDLEECEKRNIAVCNVPFYGENTVAEHTFALILSLSRNVHESYMRTLKDDYSIEGLQGFDLKGKTLGVIGTGHIGMHVIRIAKGFGMHVKAFDVDRQKFISELLHFNYVDSLNELYEESDIITLHVPSLPSTKHMISGEAIKKMKKGAIIINTSRGDLIDTDALYKGLRSGKIGGAGLDVIEGENIIKEEKELLEGAHSPEKYEQIVRDKEIFKMGNVVFTPHIAFYSEEAIERIMQTSADNFKHFLEGNLKNLVKHNS